MLQDGFAEAQDHYNFKGEEVQTANTTTAIIVNLSLSLLSPVSKDFKKTKKGREIDSH
jgi:hypothetical protein